MFIVLTAYGCCCCCWCFRQSGKRVDAATKQFHVLFGWRQRLFDFWRLDGVCGMQQQPTNRPTNHSLVVLFICVTLATFFVYCFWCLCFVKSTWMKNTFPAKRKQLNLLASIHYVSMPCVCSFRIWKCLLYHFGEKQFVPHTNHNSKDLYTKTIVLITQMLFKSHPSIRLHVIVGFLHFLSQLFDINCDVQF